MKGMRFLDAFVQVVKATSPEDWARYCELASKIAHVWPETEAESDEVGRKKLAGHVKSTRAEAVRDDFRDVFPEVFKLESAFPDLFVKAMRSNRISVTGFNPDDLSGPIDITPEMMDLVLDWIRRADIVDPHLADAWVDWDASTIQFGHRTLIGVRVTLKGPSQGSQQGGRPTVADWDAAEDALSLEIKERGLPSRDNEKGWQTKEDVCRWVAELLEARGESAAWSTIKARVNIMLKCKK
jgi:hypothetical protein